MPGRPWVLAETTWRTVRDTAYEVAVLPWGATEAHNLHLPYERHATDPARPRAAPRPGGPRTGTPLPHRGLPRRMGLGAFLMELAAADREDMYDDPPPAG